MKRHVALLSALVAVVAALLWATPAFPQSPAVLVDDTTPGRYNAALGTALDATQPQFPCAGSLCGDPTINPAPEPDLSSVSSILGGWLTNPASFNANWGGPQAIPLSWDIDSETAIVYEIDAGPCGVENVTGSFGVDNGIFVWVNGAYMFGALAPGPAILGEYAVSLGNLPPGMNFLQILREDHGGASGYSVEISGTTLANCPTDDDEEDDHEDDDDEDDDDDHEGHEHHEQEHADHEHEDDA
jgi:hypothetical protein